MARTASYICSSCGTISPKWAGKCESCNSWNTIAETEALSGAGPAKTGLAAGRGRRIEITDLQSETSPPARLCSGIAEFDRVLGGGLVKGASILLGGDPGIGKSTLLLQAAAQFSTAGQKVFYISGEESCDQVRLRAKRLGLGACDLFLAAETNLANILATLESERPNLVVIDSIQTMWIDTIESAPGSVAQVRSSAYELTQYANRKGVAVILVGHVTKEGQIAGPRVVEHMVDTVLYFEGERGHHFRILRTVKNRFGPAHEIGVFEMTGGGLAEVENPSALFLGERDSVQPGAVVFAGIEGSRPVLFELQSLVVSSSLAQPRRSVIGWDGGRLAMVLAVLEARCGISFVGHDIYLNVAGGMRISEPAADLAVAVALVSAKTGKTLDKDCIFFGELSLSAALRPVNLAENRLKEAQKLGFNVAVVPERSKVSESPGLELVRCSNLETCLERLALMPK